MIVSEDTECVNTLAGTNLPQMCKAGLIMKDTHYRMATMEGDETDDNGDGGIPSTTAIGAYIRTLRERRGWTKRQLGLRAGLWGQYISQIESGHRIPKVPTLRKIAKALMVPLDDLVEISAKDRGEEQPPPPPEKEHTYEALIESLPEKDQDAMRKAIDAMMIFYLRHSLQLEANLMVARLEAEMGKSFEQIKRDALLPPHEGEDNAGAPPIQDAGT
jgi:transcriptional regulator with XRE-family HTH domain